MFRHENRIYENVVDGVVIQVVERGDQRELRFGNQIVQSARSLTAPDVLLLDYTRAMMGGFLFAPQARNILHVGLGAGSIPTFIHRHVPEAHQRIVELNPGVIEVAKRYFDLPISPRLQVFPQDGSEFIRGDANRYDLIFLDAFHADGAASHLNTMTFFQMLAAHLKPEGWLVNNAWGSDRENLRRVRTHMGLAFDQMVSMSVRAESNVIFFVSRTADTPAASLVRRRARTLSQRFPLDFEQLMTQLRPTFPSSTSTPSPGYLSPH